MKKILFVCFILINAALNAQDVKFGVHIDPGICWLSPESKDVGSQGGVFGFSGGLIVDRYFQDNYAFTSGIGMGTQGGKLQFGYDLPLEVYDDVDTLREGTTLKYNLQYITVPIGLKLKSNQIGYVTFYVNLGFSNQLNIKAKATTSNTDELNDDSIRNEINWFDLGYYFGGGIEYALSKDTSVLVGVIYRNGFLDVTSASPNVNSRVLALRLGILF
jgi:hypothetical protein